VEIDLKGGKDYSPNMVALIKIVDYKNDNVIVAPVNTIQRAQDNDFVFIAENNRAKKVTVKTGKIYNGNIEILSGLKAGDQLITAGYQDLNDGEAIKH
jgi:membrane fusion protein, multidrug efflux system